MCAERLDEGLLPRCVSLARRALLSLVILPSYVKAHDKMGGTGAAL